MMTPLPPHPLALYWMPLFKINTMANKNKDRAGQQDNQRSEDNITRTGNKSGQQQGNKDNQNQGNNQSRQGDGGNRGKRGNRGLG
jgi:hypothetical protein